MIIAAINLTLIESLAFLLVALIFGVSIYLFLKSRQSLQQTIRSGKGIFTGNLKKDKVPENLSSPFFDKEKSFARFKQKVQETAHILPGKIIQGDENFTQDLKHTISQQQKLLNTYLRKVEDLENEGKEELKKENKELQREILKLQDAIDQKNAELEELPQETLSARKMAGRVEEVYREFDLLQEKMASLEMQAGRANGLAIELEDVKHSYEAVHNELLRKQEKLEDVLADNQKMRQSMDVLEDKLAEANLQRQQLQKKVQFLTDLNTDLQSISDTNKKLQTELRRIGELESMLNMMAEERDFLLRRKKDK